MNPYIVISGGIAAGKTTAAAILGKALDVPPLLECPDRSPFLESFYGDNRRWALASCMWFLLRGLDLQAGAAASGGVQDHWPLEGVHVFGNALSARGAIEPRELDLLARQLDREETRLRQPDLVIALEAPVDYLERRIQARGRDYERAIDRPYLEAMKQLRAELLARWIGSPLLRIDTTELDFRTDAGGQHLVGLTHEALAA